MSPVPMTPVSATASRSASTAVGRCIAHPRLLFDFNGVLFCDADFQVESWQGDAKDLRRYEMTDDELATHMHDRPNADVLTYLAGRVIEGNELLDLIQVKGSFYRKLFFIQHLRLDSSFDVEKIVYDDGIGPGKHAPDTYLTAAQNIGLNPSQCVVVEDAISGIQSAQAAGLGPPATHANLLALAGVATAMESLAHFPREVLLEHT